MVQALLDGVGDLSDKNQSESLSPVKKHIRHPELTFSSIIHRSEMKSRSKVTKRQKVRRTSEMVLRSAGGTNRYGEGRDIEVE